MATKNDIIQTVAMLSAAYSNFQPNEYTPRVFDQILGDLPADLLEAATMKCLGEARAFAPAPGEIREVAGKLRIQAAGIPSAAMAFEEVVGMPASMTRIVSSEWDDVKKLNWINKVNLHFSHPFVEAAARRLGWPKTFPTDNPSADRAQFYRIYESELSNTIHDDMQLPLVGKYLEANKAQLLLGDLTKRLKKK